jgi:hypothetical protein
MTKSKNPEENIMIRKSILALTAVAALGAAALAPTSASAWGFKGGGFHHHGFGWGGGYGIGFVGAPTYVTLAPDCYYVKKITRSGFVKIIKVCE